jgi:hypothetical protein
MSAAYVRAREREREREKARGQEIDSGLNGRKCRAAPRSLSLSLSLSCSGHMNADYYRAAYTTRHA